MKDMDLFLKRYKDTFKAEMVESGFTSYKRTYYRVINDVVQFFALHRQVPFGRTCTVEFDVYPLCLGLDKDSLIEALYDIGYLSNRGSRWWDYDPHDEESVMEVVGAMYAETRGYLMPFFRRITDSKSAYEAICSLERSIYTKVPGGIIMNNYAFVCFTLKMRAYDRTLQHLRAIVEQNLSHRSAEDQDRIKNTERFKRLMEQIERVSIPDVDYINDFITRNEAYSLANICRPRTERTCLGCPRNECPFRHWLGRTGFCTSAETRTARPGSIGGLSARQ